MTEYTPVDPTLLTRAHLNFVESLKPVARALPGGEIVDTGGMTMVVTGLPVAEMNMACVFDAPADPEAVVARAQALYEGRGVPWELRATREAARVLQPAAEAAGLVWDGAVPGMLLMPLAGTVPVVPGLRVEAVRDVQAAHHFIDVTSTGFDAPTRAALAAIAPSLLTIPDYTCYLGWMDGVPVAAAARHTTHRIAGIYNVATLPAYRGRGIGRAITWRAMLDGQAEGCLAASLQASAMGFPIYERMGYRLVTSYPSWAARGASAETGQTRSHTGAQSRPMR